MNHSTSDDSRFHPVFLLFTEIHVDQVAASRDVLPGRQDVPKSLCGRQDLHNRCAAVRSQPTNSGEAC
jgi:hypothetical protein